MNTVLEIVTAGGLVRLKTAVAGSIAKAGTAADIGRTFIFDVFTVALRLARPAIAILAGGTLELEVGLSLLRTTTRIAVSTKGALCLNVFVDLIHTSAAHTALPARTAVAILSQIINTISAGSTDGASTTVGACSLECECRLALTGLTALARVIGIRSTVAVTHACNETATGNNFLDTVECCVTFSCQTARRIGGQVTAVSYISILQAVG